MGGGGTVAVKAAHPKRPKPNQQTGRPRGRWKPLGGPKAPLNPKGGAPLRQQQQRKQQHNASGSSTDDEGEEEGCTEGSLASDAEAAAAAAGDGSSSESSVSSADSSEELRCSSESEFESEDAGIYEDTEGPPSSVAPNGAAKGEKAPSSDGLQEALGAELRQRHPDFLDFVLNSGTAGDEGEGGDSGSEETPSAADSEEEAPREETEGQPQQQQQQQKRRLLTRERFLGICKAIGLDPLETKKETGDLQQQQQPQPLGSFRGAQLLLEALHSAVLQLAPREQQTTAAGALSAAAAASAGERSKFKHAKQQHADEEGHQQQQQRDKMALKRLQQQQQQQRSSSSSKATFALPDGDTCAFVLLAVVRSADSLFTGLSVRGPDAAAAATAAAAAAGTAVPEAGTSRMRRLLKAFWADLTHLLLAARQQTAAAAAAAGSKELVVQLLLALSSKRLLRWVLTQEAHARRLLQAVSRYWAFAQHEQQQLAAFAVLRSALLLQQGAAATAAAAAPAAGGCKKRKATGEAAASAAAGAAAAHAAGIAAEMKEQQLLQQLLRSYQKAAARLGIRRTWRAASRMQLLQNEMRELLSLAAPSTAYRIAYQSIRELALTVRSALAVGGGAAAPAAGSSSSSSSRKGKKDVSRSRAAAAHKRRHRLQQAQSLVFCWPFISSCGLWASSLGLHQGHLKPLAFPLVSVAAAAVKLQQQQLACAPFCLNLLEAIAVAGIVADALVPVAAPLLAVLQLLLQQHAAVCRRNNSSSSSGAAAAGRSAAAAAAATQGKKRKRGAADKPAANAASGPLRLQQAAAAYVETCLRIDAAQQESLHVLESLVNFGSCLLARHLAQLAAHPALPELLLPVASSLKQLLKKAGQFGAAKKLQQLAAAAATSAETVKRLRVSLKEMPIGRVAVLPIHKEKQQMPLLALSEKLMRERQQAMAEGIKEELAAADHRKKKETEETLTAKQIKRRRQKEQKRAAKEEEEQLQKRQQEASSRKRKESRDYKETAAPANPTEDALEEFSSDVSDA